MELTKVINTRRTIRDFSCKKVPDEIVNKALKAGLKAPSYNHLKQWHFILVNDVQTRLALTQTEKMSEKVTDKIKASFANYDNISKEMYLDAIPRQKQMIINAPRLLVMAYKVKTPIENVTRIYDLNGLASAWCCIENILLSLAEDDVFGVTFVPKNTQGIKNILNIPNGYEIASFIPFGYKSESPKTFPQKEIDLNDVLHHNKW